MVYELIVKFKLSVKMMSSSRQETSLILIQLILLFLPVGKQRGTFVNKHFWRENMNTGYTQRVELIMNYDTLHVLDQLWPI